MFTKPRPVPSKAALKALYQLAYISSGTAAGVATLCAEERRRKTRILQQIADNAKRLRDSPRHVHNAARALEKDDFDIRSMNPGYESSYNYHRNQENGWQSVGAVDMRLARGEELPSKVEQGYDQLRPDREHVRGRGRRRRSRVAVRNVSKPGATRNDGSRAKLSRESRFETSLGSSNFRGNDLVYQSWRPGSRLNPFYRNRWLKQSGSEDVHKEPCLRTTALRTTSRESASEHPTHETRYRPEMITADVEQCCSFDPHNATSNAIKEADELLRIGFLAGTPSEVRSVVLWRFATGTEVVFHARSLTSALLEYIEGPLTRSDDDELFLVIGDLFATGRIRRLPKRMQLDLRLAMTKASHTRNPHISLTEHVRTFLTPALYELGPKSQVRLLRDAVQRLLEEDDVHALLLLLDDFELHTGYCPMFFIDNAFDAAMSRGRLAVCSRLLARKFIRQAFDDKLVTQYEKFVAASSQQGTTYMLKQTLIESKRKESKHLAWLIAKLSGSAKDTLARAIAEHKWYAPETFKMLLKEASVSVRDELGGIRLANDLRARWETTRDLSAVREHYDTTRKTASMAQSNAMDLRAAEIAFIEILCTSNNTEEAIDILADFNKTRQHSSDSLCTTAWVLANKKAWTQFTTLMRILGETPGFLTTTTASRSLVQSLRLYSASHSAEKTWELASFMLETLKLPPRRAINSVVLQRCIKAGNLSLIPRWLKYVESLGGEAKMDAACAADLFESYYLEHRLPHSFLMYLCSHFVTRGNITDQAPFLDLIKESIGYDKRHFSGNMANRSWLIKLISSNLRKVQLADGIVPIPLQKADVLDDDRYHKGHRGRSDLPRPQLPADLPAELHADLTMDDRAYAPESGITVESPSTKVDSQMIRKVGVPQEALLAHASTPGPDSSMPADLPSFLQPTDVQYLQESEMEEMAFTSDQRKSRAQVRQLEREMIYALSRREFHVVLELYRGSTGTSGLPASPRVLEIAIEASLQRCDGQSEEAEQLLDRAKEAGMNTTCAIGPMLIREMRAFSLDNKRDANLLRTKVINYYRTNNAHGWRVQHHVAVHAAYILIQNGCAEHGVNLLNVIYRSEWATERPYDIVAMTTYIRGFAVMRNERGIRWAVDHVLKSNMRIDAAFLEDMKLVTKNLRRANETGVSRSTVHLIRLLQSYRSICSQRRMQQKSHSGKLGWQLMHCLLECRESQGLIKDQAVSDLESLDESWRSFEGKDEVEYAWRPRRVRMLRPRQHRNAQREVPVLQGKQGRHDMTLMEGTRASRRAILALRRKSQSASIVSANKVELSDVALR